MTQTEKKMALKPIGNRVLLQRLEQDAPLKGGIILPDSAKKKQETAVVICIGTGKRLENGEIIPIPVNEGDTVLIDKYAGQEVTIADEEFVIANSDDIIAIVQK